MSDQTLICPEPLAPCLDCVQRAQFCDESLAIVYCPHRKFGGIFQTEIGQWHIVGPFGSEKEFKRSVHNNLARQVMRKAV